eukprot:TRINITY_DN5556_c0_g1::TRINITY_DN5556_c0_g1_i1::g.9416::m.9416 TRINITY_DN5556_c0_g1::TRINITY_DN5556_c0_g1_i1::g.9416  ORF type:complete len:355 (+),score=77.93,sp/Q55G91/U160_DICDI/49.84/1e-111,UPF0160/PF03690.8/8.7e-131 TRINITY_DN5556_c0_g1_i1:57-1067(+)
MAALGKRICTRIGTHNGSFHVDEAMACWMLKQLPLFSAAEVVRTRDPEVLKTMDVVVDVGGVYEPENMRFDHHQREFTTTFSDKHPIKLSSAGLIYKHFGRDVIQALAGNPLQADELEVVYNKIYTALIESLDAIDNGVSQYEGNVKPKYKISTDLSARVGRLNPRWNETHQDYDSRFARAMQMAGEEFLAFVENYVHSWLPARHIVVDAIQARTNTCPSGNIAVLAQACPWQDHLLTLEEELGLTDKIIYMIYPDTNGSWRVQAVPVATGSFQSRLALPEPWRGVRDNALSELTGIPGGIFVHATGFIGGNQTKEGAVEMALKALELGKDKIQLA